MVLRRLVTCAAALVDAGGAAGWCCRGRPPPYRLPAFQDVSGGEFLWLSLGLISGLSMLLGIAEYDACHSVATGLPSSTELRCGSASAEGGGPPTALQKRADRGHC